MGVPSTLRRRVFETLDYDPRTAPEKAWVSIALIALIGANVLAVVLESVDALRARYGALFDAFELFSLVVFSAEYLLRLWTAPEDPRFASPWTGRLRYATGPMPIIDLLAIVPSVFLVLGATGLDLRFLRMLRFFRLMRLLKLGRYSPALQTFARVFSRRRDELVVAMAAASVLLILTSSAMYLAEHDAQPEKFSSIPETMWWSVITLMTVGYGDVVPITAAGKVLGGITAMLGVGVVAMPAAILASGFLQELEERKKKPVPVAEPAKCPHCGKDVSAAASLPAPHGP